jgi:hypothetical protein
MCVPKFKVLIDRTKNHKLNCHFFLMFQDNCQKHERVKFVGKGPKNFYNCSEGFLKGNITIAQQSFCLPVFLPRDNLFRLGYFGQVAGDFVVVSATLYTVKSSGRLYNVFGQVTTKFCRFVLLKNVRLPSSKGSQLRSACCTFRMTMTRLTQ